MTNISGDDVVDLTDRALAAGVTAIENHTERLSQNVAKKSIRKLMIEKLPNDDVLLDGKDVTLQNNARSILEKRKQELDVAVANVDWETILTKYPVRESSALVKISEVLGFNNRLLYEKAVRQLLAKDAAALQFVRELFDNLYDQLNC